ncbi:hypothetical protein Bhyg_05041 [Pseudolycoriella hygida]|uniref:Uncharacterized protein n=1 Tax=Pseudolycoriella hygida TaxID=35572 RepID=A0A9Q0NHK9_9DIPT|nr:hypothetical protein Bhyg_05041 [Pseudolycoriella hygida]
MDNELSSRCILAIGMSDFFDDGLHLLLLNYISIRIRIFYHSLNFRSRSLFRKYLRIDLISVYVIIKCLDLTCEQDVI